MRLKEGEKAPHFDTADIFGVPIRLDNFSNKRMLLSFYRFSSCPFCNLRVRNLIQKYPDFERQGLVILSFWQSSIEKILEDVGQQKVPFPLIPDPDGKIYARYSVEGSWWAALKVAFHPRQILQAAQRGFMTLKITGRANLVPADFLVGPDLTIKRAYYGSHIADHIPISEIESFLAAGKERSGF